MSKGSPGARGSSAGAIRNRQVSGSGAELSGVPPRRAGKRWENSGGGKVTRRRSGESFPRQKYFLKTDTRPLGQVSDSFYFSSSSVISLGSGATTGSSCSSWSK